MLGDIISFILEVTSNLFLYALILNGARTDKKVERKEEKIE